MSARSLVAAAGLPTQGIDPGRVSLTDRWLAPRCRTSADDGLLSLLEQFDRHGVVDRFRFVDRPAKGLHFSDSDLYKWMEAAAWAVGAGAGAELRQRLDELVVLVTAAAEPSGYLHTYWPREGRYDKLWESHDLYCAGHLMQAAVAASRALDDDRLLRAACAFADHICVEFGAAGRQVVDGHPEVEMALVELFRQTGQRRYLDQAVLFLHRSEPAQMQRVAGHAVRILYYGAGLADACAEVDDEVLASAEERLWRSLVDQHLYVTGAVGGRWMGEAVGRPFELPSQSAYAETCAAVAVVMWAWRRAARGGQAGAEAVEVLERALHNAVLAGIGLDARSYFYSNALASSAESEPYPWRYPDDWHARSLVEFHPLRRQEWFPCTCCPPNVHRLLQQVPGMVYSVGAQAVYVHLHVASVLDTALPDGRRVRVQQQTGMPFEETVEITVEVEDGTSVMLHVRMPGWCDRGTIDGQPCTPGRYHQVEVRGSRRVLLQLDLTPRMLQAHPKVTDLRDQVAVQRGPLVYCAEGVDNPEFDVQLVRVDPDAEVEVCAREELLGGVSELVLRGWVEDEPQTLYRRADAGNNPARPVTLRLVPYGTWANRGLTTMTTWLRRHPPGKPADTKP